MRVASNTIYFTTISRLSRVNDEMLKINTMITTGKRINKLEDDPVGLSRVVSLKSAKSNLEQIQTNIATGQTWLEAGEQALNTSTDLITEAKTLAISMNNGIMSDADRYSGAVQIDGLLEQIMALSNTTVQGQYMFSGTKTDVPAYTLDETGSVTKAVYGGNESPFKIKIATNTDVDVGADGSTIFENTKIVIDDTNNKIDFMEDPTGGLAFYGAELTAIIPNGEYTPDELAVAVGAAMTTRSAATGQPEIISVTQNDANFVVDNYAALTVPTGGTNIDLTYTAASNTWAVTDVPAGYTSGVTALELQSDATKAVLDFDGDGIGDVTVNFSSAVADAYLVSFDITAAAAGGNAVSYDASYNSGTEKYTILETGAPADLTSLKMMWETGTNTDTTLGVDMGFDVSSDDTGAADGTNHVSDTEVQWGIFRTLIDLKGYLESSDTEGINRSISRLTADFNHIESFVSVTGIKQNRLDIRDNIIEDLTLSYESNRMKIEDADVIETFSLLQQKQFAYEAALSSTSRILNVSLLNYL